MHTKLHHQSVNLQDATIKDGIDAHSLLHLTAFHGRHEREIITLLAAPRGRLDFIRVDSIRRTKLMENRSLPAMMKLS